MRTPEPSEIRGGAMTSRRVAGRCGTFVGLPFALVAAVTFVGGVGAALVPTISGDPASSAAAAPRFSESAAARRGVAQTLDRAAADLDDAAAAFVTGAGTAPATKIADARAAIGDATAAAAGVAPRRTRGAILAACAAADRRCARAESRLATGGGEPGDDDDMLRAILAAGAAVRRATRLAGVPGVLTIRELGAARSAPRRPGDVVRVRVLRALECDEDPAVTFDPDDPVLAPLGGLVTQFGADRYRFVLGPDAGTATVTATACGETATYRIVNAGERGVLDIAGPAGFSFAAGIDVRVGDAVAVAPSYVGGPATFSVSPPLPAGLVLDADDGSIDGTAAETASATYTVLARNARGVARATVAISVEEALPAGVVSLERGFRIEKVTDADSPVRLALAPDGRVFFGELLSGNVRVIAADGTLLATPYATLPLLTGGERGLLGLCIAPDFATSGHLYVAASAAAGDGHLARNRVVRFTGTGDVATSGPDVVVDDLPIGDTQNGGAVEFGPDGMLYVTVGDTGNELLAQSDSSRAGRVLRFSPDGSIPGDGPIQGSPEFARGFRNPFDITFHPATGGLFASENGPTAHDELEFVQRGKNFEWGAEPESIPGPVIGRRIIDWTPVIVPTGIVFHDGAGFGVEYADNLFVAGYDKGDVRRLVLSGPSYSDLDAELPFLAFDESDFSLKPLDLQRAADGSLWVATFSSIWRISRNAQ